ncbi:hypothetical protein ACLMJK_001284 [Lecanora helva]
MKLHTLVAATALSVSVKLAAAYKGDMTHYTPGLGSCGANSSPGDMIVVDTCMGCAFEDIDVTDALFSKVAPNGDGRVHGIEWGGKVTGG